MEIKIISVQDRERVIRKTITALLYQLKQPNCSNPAAVAAELREWVILLWR